MSIFDNQIGVTPEELRKALIQLRDDFETHNHDSFNSQSFQTLRAESLIARTITSGIMGSSRFTISESALRLYNSSNNRIFQISSVGLLFYKSDGSNLFFLYANTTGMHASDNGSGLKFFIDSKSEIAQTMIPQQGANDVDLGASSPTEERFRYIYLINDPDVLSSRKTKDNIKDLTSGLDKILALKPVSFTRKEFNIIDRKYKTKEEFEVKNMGFIAEEVAEVLPEVSNGNSYQPTQIIPILVKAIQELEARVKALENKK